MRLVRGCCALLLMSATALAAGPSTAPATDPTTAPATRTFVSAAGRVRFDYPADWSLPARPLPGQLFSAQMPPAGRHSPLAVVSLQLDHAAPGMSDQAALLDLSDALAAYAFNHGGQHVTIKPDTLGTIDSPEALPARRVRFFTPRPGGTVATLYVIAVADGTEYLFTVAGPVEIFDAATTGATPMFHSFQRLQ